MKRFAALVLVILTLISLVSCASAKKETSGAESEYPKYETQKNVGNPSALGATSTENSTFPNVHIKVEGRKEIERKDIYLQARVSIDNCPEQYVLENVAAEVRRRGNGTFRMEKPAYRIRFAEKYNLFGQANGYGRSWVLLANSSDACMLRTHAVFAMAHTLENIAWTTSSSFVQLYVNDTYRGVYQLVEQHNTSDGRIEINEDPNVIDTDYLIELDEYAGSDGSLGIDWFQVNKFNYNGGSGKGIKINKYLIRSDYNTKEKCSFLHDYFKKADDAIIKGDYDEVSRYIDLDSFIDMYILHELSRNGDVGWSSFYMVKKAGDKIYFTCPWDFDNTFGNDGRIHKNSYKYLHAGNGVQKEKQSHSWYFTLFQRKWFVDMVAKRWNEVAEGMRDTAIKEIDRIYNDFGAELVRNYEVWKVKTKKYETDFDPPLIQDSYDEHVEFLKLYLNLRYDWLNDYFNSDQKYEQLAAGER